MNKYILLLCLMAIAIISNAQGDAKAKAILDNVSAKMKALKAVKANFSITITGAKGGKPQTKTGNVFMKGTKYCVNISGQEIYSDSKTNWTYMKESNEVQISAYDPSESSFSPSKLLTNFYDKEFAYRYVGTSTLGGKKVEVVHLVPTTKTNKYSKVELYVDAKNSIVAGGKLYEKNGNIYSYNVSGYTPNPTLTDAMFVFDAKKHPKVEVVDLR
jgi:outer membrane lipoprotein carrier protein